jgi:hypothetical protein
MYDVLFLDSTRRGSVVARRLDRRAAVDCARSEARRRRVGRMFLTGSERPAGCVVIVESPR